MASRQASLRLGRRRFQRLDSDDVQEIDLDGPLIKNVARLTRQSDGRGPLANHKKVGMPNLVGRAVGHDDAKRLEWLLPQGVAKFLRRHDSGSVIVPIIRSIPRRRLQSHAHPLGRELWWFTLP